jgi:anti-sigma B factor antagonist
VSATCTVALSATTIHTTTLAGVPLVTVAGEIDLVSAGPLRLITTAELDRRPSGLIVDLTGVVFFSAAGIHALVAAATQAHTHGTAMVVVTDDRIVLRPLRLTGADQELRIRSTVDLALSALAPRRVPSPALHHSRAAAM